MFSLVLSPFAAIRDAMRPYWRFDRDVAVLVIVFSLLFLPLLHRGTENPQLMAAFSNDEPWQVMALEAMTEKPFGNPANFFRVDRELPRHWGNIRYDDMLYYGGAQLDLAFLVFAPLHALGVPTFPAAPTILRAVSTVSALLSLILLYNFSRVHAGRLAAFLGVLVLLTDSNFLYYTTNIKPDTLQFLLGMVALPVAVCHARDRRMSSLVAVGVLAGFIQGTKAGGAWIIPVAVLAAWLGTAKRSDAAAVGDRLPLFVWRLACMGIAAIAAYFITTPYAFLDPRFRTMVEAGWANLHKAPLPPVTMAGWLMEFYVQWGPILVVLGAVGFSRALIRGFRSDGDLSLAFAAVIALSQLLWYGTVVRLWASLGYLLLGLGCFALFAGDTLARAVEWLRQRGGPGRVAGLSCGILLSLLVLEDRWQSLPLWVLQLHNFERNTVLETNRWAIEHGIEPASRIVSDDIAYFDPQRFPAARMHGGVLKWVDVSRYQADYLVLSLPVLHANPFSELMKTQRLSRADPYPFSMRLYQDLIHAQYPGPTQVPGVELVALIQHNLAQSGGGNACTFWAGGRGTYVFQYRGVREMVECRAILHAQYFRELLQLAANLAGKRADLMGITLRVYRVRSLDAEGTQE